MSQYITVKEVAKKLGVCRASIYNYINTIPEFPIPRKIGRITRFLDEEVNSFMRDAPHGVTREVIGRKVNESL